jgi:hypothetical protein
VRAIKMKRKRMYRGIGGREGEMSQTMYAHMNK